MQVVVPSIAETACTGYVGSVVRTIKGVDYEVRFSLQAGALTAIPGRNGLVVDWSAVTRRMEANGRKFFTASVSALLTASVEG